MGAEPYYYFVKYQADADKALQELREHEFAAGRYNPVMPFLDFPASANSPAPGAEHDSIEEAMEASDADGTRSILDLQTVGEEPDFCVACRLPEETLLDLYDTTEPTHEMLEQNMGFLEDLERGHGIYTVVYKNGKPDELFFAGYSFD
ncbi:MAG: hypothetical protein ACREHD_04945 [Pirellulales bacterium]